MRLDRVEVKNFRSIKETTITFDPPCRVLVGINESGKSNVLKALRLLSDDYKPSKIDDVRERVGREKPITEAHVWFIFKLDKPDSDQVFEEVAGKILSSAKNPEVVLNGADKLSLGKFCASRNEGLYVVDLLEETKDCKYWVLAPSHKLLPGWKKPSPACPADYTVEVAGEQKKLKEYKLIREADFPEVPKEHLVDATIDELSKLIGSEITDIVESNIPETIFWEYDENDLLPNSVDILSFANALDSCPPLKNMFILGGIPEKEIKTSIEEKLKGTPNQIQNYLNQIAEQTTEHFREVWEEYKDISFSLDLNGNTIVPGIREENTHDFAKRSDGFKRFVTFLLMISVKVKTNQMENTLLLIDEPEISLHPTGARYLRNELIRISKQNYVVYSTHSIFMIDSGDIGRHYIVKKSKEVTTLKQAESSNIAEEEVLFNALGYSAFETLKEKNIIFEGWKDKKLFQTALPKASATIKRKFEGVGICHAKGVSSMKAITPIIELAKRQCLIISDSDGPAQTEQKKYNNDKGYGTWKTYQEVDSSIQAITGEDFVTNQFIAESVNEVVSVLGMPQFSETLLPSDKGKLVVILDWLVTNGMTQEQAKSTLNSIKDRIFANLEAQHIEPTYTVLLQGITL